MPQIFRPSSNSIAYFSLIAFVVMLLLVSVAAYIYFQSSYHTGVGLTHEQPIPFSHKHHVGGMGLDCRFCHAVVEKSRTAGMPSTEVCMSCHSQIYTDSKMLAPLRKSYAENKPIIWNRVHVLADYVYFDHSIHVNKGVACISCHGDVGKMPLTSKQKPLTMKWCLQCHTHPEGNLVTLEQVYKTQKSEVKKTFNIQNALMETYHIDRSRLLNCYECHR